MATQYMEYSMNDRLGFFFRLRHLDMGSGFLFGLLDAHGGVSIVQTQNYGNQTIQEMLIFTNLKKQFVVYFPCRME